MTHRTWFTSAIGVAALIAALLVFAGGSEAESGAGSGGPAKPEVAAPAAPSGDRIARAVPEPAGASRSDRGRRGVVLRVRNTPYGKVLHDKRTGLAAYLFTKEKRGGKPRCFGNCARAWPPITTKGRPIAGKGVAQGKLGTVKRRGGGRMVTYAGRPLYTYVADSPGQILCDDVYEYGGDWFVIGPDGSPAKG